VLHLRASKIWDDREICHERSRLDADAVTYYGEPNKMKRCCLDCSTRWEDYE